jgi:hypothetical protein
LVFFRKTKLKNLPQNILYPKSYLFCELKPHAQFWNPTITPSGRKETRQRERKRNSPFIVDTLFRDIARKSLGPIIEGIFHLPFTFFYDLGWTRLLCHPGNILHSYLISQWHKTNLCLLYNLTGIHYTCSGSSALDEAAKRRRRKFWKTKVHFYYAWIVVNNYIYVCSRITENKNETELHVELGLAK